MTHAFHSSSLNDNGVRIQAGEPGGYIIRLPGGVTLYHAGDTALFGDMKLIRELYKPHSPCFPSAISSPWARAKLLTPSAFSA